jgi:hypothetical protein
MDSEHQRMRPSPPRITPAFWRRLGLDILIVGVVIIVAGWAMYDGLYVHPSIQYQLRCADRRQCVLTIQHAGGGFDHGFNPAYSWAITGDPGASLRFSPASGTLQAHHSVQVRIMVAPGTCPDDMTMTSKSKHDILHFSPFLANPQTGQCRVVAPILATGQ